MFEGLDKEMTFQSTLGAKAQSDENCALKADDLTWFQSTLRAKAQSDLQLFSALCALSRSFNPRFVPTHRATRLSGRSLGRIVVSIHTPCQGTERPSHPGIIRQSRSMFQSTLRAEAQSDTVHGKEKNYNQMFQSTLRAKAQSDSDPSKKLNFNMLSIRIL